MYLRAGEAINLAVRNMSGSVEHYYHFLLGYLFPLAIRHAALHSQGFSGCILVRSCGPMDRILREVKFPGVEIISKHEHHLNSSKATLGGLPLRQEIILGMDFVKGGYPVDLIQHAAKIVQSRLGDRIPYHGVQTSTLNTAKNRRVLLINRSINPFYNSTNAERPTSGLQRRSIKNFHEVRRNVETLFGEVRVVVLENRTLAEQISLFASADLVIAQHGAALANVVWCRPGTRVIEIAPSGYRVQCFPPLSKLLKLDHRIVVQDGEHGDCSISNLVESLLDQSKIQG
jgi:hypothetical protein